jgi:parvulin-like peptidyl-prolyl isomerase
MLLLPAVQRSSSFSLRNFLILWLSLAAAGYTSLILAANVPPAKSVSGTAAPNYLAKVGPDTIMLAEYYEQLQTGIKEKFFHGKIPDKELKQFQRDLAQQMINKMLYVQEAKRRGIAPNKEEVAQKIKNLERKNKNDTYWQEHKDQMIKVARTTFELDSIVKQLETSIRNAVDPATSEVQNYYQTNEDKFTAPERVKVHLIMLKVDPSASSKEWDETAKFAGELVKKIRQGEKFEELARVHSGDDTAASGGDMGYIHKGMMGDNAAAVLDTMKLGEVSEPVYLLEGIAIFRLDDREQARVNELPRVEGSAKELLRKEMAEKAWQSFTENLRKKTEITLNESVLK